MYPDTPLPLRDFWETPGVTHKLKRALMCLCCWLHAHVCTYMYTYMHWLTHTGMHLHPETLTHKQACTHTDTHTYSELPHECTHSCIKGEALSWSCTGRRVSGTFQRQQWGEAQGGRCWGRGSRATFLINEIETLLGFQELPEAVTPFRQE